jgi:steroid delta-isomerase-like uncharacterized protein
MDRAESELLVRRLIEFVFNQKRIGLIDHFYSPDCHGGSPDGPFEGRDQLRAAFQKYESAFPGFHIGITHIFADDQRVVVQYTFVGTHKGSLAGYPPTGHTLRVPGFMVLRISDFRLVEHDFLWDNLGPRRKLWLASVVERQYVKNGAEIPIIE